MENILECVDTALELLALALANLPLEVSISISMFILYYFDRLKWVLIIKENNVFANSLLGTTIQDGSMRERSKNGNDHITIP